MANPFWKTGVFLQNYILLTYSAFLLLNILFSGVENMFTQKPEHDVYSNIIHNCPNL